PVKTDTIGGHPMHEETTFIQREVVASLKEAVEAGRPIIPVGTTSTRLLESLYWYGVQVENVKAEGGKARSGLPTRLRASAGQASDFPLPTSHFHTSQWQPYET
ncbi:MAG: S-adenosylmethionine:tRNA ribosyltransferase-isomerase, partial [Phaeodactylibacter sp.]|nr:S-adenosylmethionine:tRNA ribosyltransferase-isomerase [Phaeodactylibacter sp.]